MTTETNQEITNAEAPASLSIQDLVNIRNVIDVATQRGAFRANELSTVGTLFDKLSTFIDAVVPAQEQTQNKAEKEQEASAEE